jgi:hypothetical protein
VALIRYKGHTSSSLQMGHGVVRRDNPFQGISLTGGKSDSESLEETALFWSLADGCEEQFLPSGT